MARRETMNMSSNNDGLPTNLCTQIFLHYLTRRRETVIRALLELRPELVLYANLQMIYDVPNLEAKVIDFKAKRDSDQIPIRGIWDRNWQYEFHGIGCRLSNRISGESFDWDMDRPDRFFLGEVEMHLEWRLQSDTDANEIRWFSDWVKNHGSNFDLLLDYLKRNELIVEVETHTWIITDKALKLL